MLTKKFSQSSGSTNVVSVMCTKQRPWSDFKLEASVPQTQGNEISKKHSRTIVHVCWSYKMWFVTFVASSAQNKLYFKWHLELGGGEGQFLCRQLAAQLRQSPPPPLRPGSSPRDFATCQTSPMWTRHRPILWFLTFPPLKQNHPSPTACPHPPAPRVPNSIFLNLNSFGTHWAAKGKVTAKAFCTFEMETISTRQVHCRVLVTLTHESNSLGECLLDYLRGFRPIPHENVFEIADLFLVDVGEIAWDWAILASAASYQGGGATFQHSPMVDPISPVNHSVNAVLCQHSTILSTFNNIVLYQHSSHTSMFPRERNCLSVWTSSLPPNIAFFAQIPLFLLLHYYTSAIALLTLFAQAHCPRHPNICFLSCSVCHQISLLLQLSLEHLVSWP